MKSEKKKIRRWLIFFMVSLAFSGITAMPAEAELSFLCDHISSETAIGTWLLKVLNAMGATNSAYPFLAYGYDWLAFAHIVLAVLFIGPLRDPVKNKWVIEFGMIACVMIIPFAMIAGYFRGIPLGWRFIDCSFGIIGFVPLRICLDKIKKIQADNQNHYAYV